MAAPAFLRATGVSFTPASTGGDATTLSATPMVTGGFVIIGSTHYTTGINISAITDTVGNLYVRAGTVQGGDANQDNEIWYTPAPTVGTTSCSIIVSYTGTAQYRDVSQLQFSWGGASSITYHAEATHAFLSGSAQTSNTLSVADEGLVVGNWVAYDTPNALSSGTGTIGVQVPNYANTDQATAYRIFTASSNAATIGLVLNSPGNRYSIVAKAFRADAGTTTPALALQYCLCLTSVGR